MEIEQEVENMVKVAKPGQWYYTVGRFKEACERAVELGYFEAGPNPCDVPWPAYRLKRGAYNMRAER